MRDSYELQPEDVTHTVQDEDGQWTRIQRGKSPVPVSRNGELASTGASAPVRLAPGTAVGKPEQMSLDRSSAYDAWKGLNEVQVGMRSGRRIRRGAPSVVEFSRADPIAKGFDLLRTRLVRTIRAYGWSKIAVVSPTAGCGATFTAVNLALSLSRVPGSRTVLMDLNQRSPGVANALGLRNVGRLDKFLGAETALEDYMVLACDGLALGLADAPNEFAAELLHDPLTSEVLDEMTLALKPDLVIYDMPPMLVYDDLSAFLSEVDGVLLVADGTQTTPEQISACERILEGQTQLLGVVLNRARSDVEKETAI